MTYMRLLNEIILLFGKVGMSAGDIGKEANIPPERVSRIFLEKKEEMTVGELIRVLGVLGDINLIMEPNPKVPAPRRVIRVEYPERRKWC